VVGIKRGALWHDLPSEAIKGVAAKYENETIPRYAPSVLGT
jgi:hypothetical protein